MEVAGGDDHHSVARRILKPESRFESGLLNLPLYLPKKEHANEHHANSLQEAR
jgi:hypothetical protein